jgi:hypothetical protein
VAHDAEGPRGPASERLQLEVALLTSANAPSENSAPAGEARRHTVLVAIADPDLRCYCLLCLRKRNDLWVQEVGAGESVFDMAKNVHADLVVADMSLIANGGAAAAMTPVLVIGDELPQPVPAAEEVQVAFLLQTFNAKRLLDVVEGMLPVRRQADGGH